MCSRVWSSAPARHGRSRPSPDFPGSDDGTHETTQVLGDAVRPPGSCPPARLGAAAKTHVRRPRPAGCPQRAAGGHAAQARLAAAGLSVRAQRHRFRGGGRVFPAPLVSVLQGEGRDLRSLLSRLMTHEINTQQHRTGKLLDELIWEPRLRRKIRPGFPGGGQGGHTHGPLSFPGIGVFADNGVGLGRGAAGLCGAEDGA